MGGMDGGEMDGADYAVALAAEECVELAPLWKLARAENVCNVGHRRGRNGSAGLDG